MSDPRTKDYHDVPDDELVVTFMSDLRERIAALEAENADLREQNGLLRTVVAAWAKENNVGAMTLRDALYAVELMDTVRDAWQASGMAEKYPAELFELDTLAAEHGLPLPGAGEAS